MKYVLLMFFLFNTYAVHAYDITVVSDVNGIHVLTYDDTHSFQVSVSTYDQSIIDEIVLDGNIKERSAVIAEILKRKSAKFNFDQISKMKQQITQYNDASKLTTNYDISTDTNSFQQKILLYKDRLNQSGK